MTQSLVSPLLVVSFLFLSFRQLFSERKKTTSVFLKYLKQTLAAVTDRWQAESFKKSCQDKTKKEFRRPCSDKKTLPWPLFGIKTVHFLILLQFWDNEGCLFSVVNRLGIKLPSPQIFCLSPHFCKNQVKILWSASSGMSPPSWREGFQTLITRLSAEQTKESFSCAASMCGQAELGTGPL